MYYTFRLSLSNLSPLAKQQWHSQTFEIFFSEGIHKNGTPCDTHYHGLLRSQDSLNKVRNQLKKRFDFFHGIKIKGNKMYQLKETPVTDLDKILRYFFKGLLQNPIESINIPPENQSIYYVSNKNPTEQRDYCTRYWSEYDKLKKKVSFKSNKSKMIDFVKEQLEKDNLKYCSADYSHEFEKRVGYILMDYYQKNELTLNKFQFISNVQTICLLLQDLFMDNSNDYGNSKITQWFPHFQN